MARNGSGVYVAPGADFPAVATTLIQSAKYNNVVNDIGTALTGSVAADGQTTITANLPMAGYRHTGVGNAAARNDYPALGQIQDGTGTWCGTATGTADAIVLTPSPAITAYAAGQTFLWVASGANTTAVTIAVSGLAAKAAKKNGTTALGANDIPSGAVMEGTYDGTNFQVRIVADRASLAANTFTGLQNWKASADIASAATVDLTAATGNTTRITGAVATSAITMNAGQWHMCIADGAWPLTYHATTNKLNTGGANYTCVAGDRLLLVKDNSNIIQATVIPASGAAVVAIGVNQVWSNPARAVTTIYQNTTGKPIAVAITCELAVANDQARLLIESATPPTTIIGHMFTGATAGTYQFLFGIVPNNHYYRLSLVTGTPTLIRWAELS